MEENNTVFDPFCGWYRCRSCGVTETFIPPICPVCMKPVENYHRHKTEQLREDMLRRREEEDSAW